jgi:Uma2 family endonuclease
MTTAAVPPVTAPVSEEEFFARYGPKDRVELVDGVVVPKYGAEGPLSPTSNAHGRIVMNLIRALDRVVHDRGLGEVFTDPACFIISEAPKRVRCPDVAFVRAGRAPAEIALGTFLRLAPDLAAKVVSPSEPAAQVETKIAQYLEAGVRLVWKVDPRRREVTVLRHDGAVTRLGEGDELDGADVVPGFRLPVAELFAGVARR